MLGFIGAFISGMLGIGGAIINYPLLLYLPPLLGLAAFTVHEVSGISAFQVLFSTIGGVWAYRKGNYLNKSLIAYMGISSLVGSLIGGFGSNLLVENSINLMYGVLAILAALLMFIPRKQIDDVPHEQVQFNKLLAVLLSFLVGVSAGIVGAGGAFLLVPIMLVVLRIPTRMTIASSLAITFLSSIGSTIGKMATGQVPFIPAFIVIAASLLASQLGAKIGKKMNTKALQRLLALLITITALKIWFDLLF